MRNIVLWFSNSAAKMMKLMNGREFSLLCCYGNNTQYIHHLWWHISPCLPPWILYHRCSFKNTVVKSLYGWPEFQFMPSHSEVFSRRFSSEGKSFSEPRTLLPNLWNCVRIQVSVCRTYLRNKRFGRIREDQTISAFVINNWWGISELAVGYTCPKFCRHLE